MTILKHITSGPLAKYSLLLGRNACFAYAFHQQVLLKFWQSPPWLGFLAILLLATLFSLLLDRRHAFGPFPWWKEWHWYQKTVLVLASTSICLILLKSGIVSPVGYSDITITVTASQKKDMTTFYCTGLFDHKGRLILSPKKIAEEADILQCFKVVNNGNGLWCRMPDMGTTLQVRWRGKIPDRSFPVHFRFSIHPTAGVVTVGSEGITNTVNLRGNANSLKEVSLPSESRSVPLTDVLSVWLTLLFVLPRPFRWIRNTLKTDLYIPLAELVAEQPVLTLAVLIASPVIAFNVLHVFGPKYLLHDDPYFYWIGIDHMVDWWRWQIFGSLAAFTEGFSYWVMAHFSPYVVRLMYLLVYLTGISFCVYWIARRIFGLNPLCGYLAAVLPAIYPMQHQIIAAINSSYTLIGTLAVLLSLIAGFKFLVRDHYSWPLFVLATGLYAISTRLMEQAVFLSVPLAFLYLACTQNWKRKALLLLPLTFAAAMELHRMISHSRGEVATPHNLPWGEIFERGNMFLLYLSPTSEHFGIWLFTALFLLSLIGYSYTFRPHNTEISLSHFDWLPRKLGFAVLPAFVLLWVIPAALPFIGMTKYFSIRTFHIAGYGPWLLIAPGLYFLTLECTAFISPRLPTLLMAAIVIAIVGGAGIQHVVYAEKQYQRGNYYFQSLSRDICKHAIPEGSQIVITNASTGTHQSYPACTGYLSRMLGNRLDVGGLVGTEYFFYDPFAQTKLWLRPMTGLKGAFDNLHFFRWNTDTYSPNRDQNGILQPYTYFLRVVTDESSKTDTEKSGDWFVYHLDMEGKANIIYRGHGLDDYKGTLAKLELDGIRPHQICWGNPANPFGCNSPKR